MELSAFCSIPHIWPIPRRRSRFSRSPIRAAGDAAPSTEKRAGSSIVDTKFSAWTKRNGVDMSSVLLSDFSGGPKHGGLPTRGMAAAKTLSKGDFLISVSHKTVLEVNSLDRRRSRLPGKISQATWQQLPWYARLALLIVDAKKNEESDLKEWVSRLPSSFDTPFHWSDDELSELQNPRLVSAVRQQRKQYRKYFDIINGSPENQLARVMTYADFVWAVECVRSRAFSGPLEVAPFNERLRLFLFIAANTVAWPALNALPLENALNGGLTALFALAMYDIIYPRVLRVLQGVEMKRYAMTPGIDFFNHKSDVTGKAEVSFEYFRNKFVVQAGEDYDSGNEVFISYGAQSNDSLLQYYGFVEENNPADTYAFGSEFEKMLYVAEGQLVARRKGFGESTITAVVEHLGGNREAAIVTLQELCDAELKSMGTSLQEDIALLGNEGMAENARKQLAVRYRKEKKELLDCLRQKAW